MKSNRIKRLTAAVLACVCAAGVLQYPGKPRTAQAVTMADEVFELNAENYANGLCDMNTYTLAQNRRDEAYNQYLSAIEKYWTTYYHLQTLIGD